VDRDPPQLPQLPNSTDTEAGRTQCAGEFKWQKQLGGQGEEKQIAIRKGQTGSPGWQEMTLLLPDLKIRNAMAVLAREPLPGESEIAMDEFPRIEDAHKCQ